MVSTCSPAAYNRHLAIILTSQLIKSGGWLYDLAVALNTVTGAWDVVIMAVVFVFSWVWIRTSERVTALILARVFDTTIPLQYQRASSSSVETCCLPKAR